ncbi:hypothetical protein Tco_0398306 [Tanacetum coccineum]
MVSNIRSPDIKEQFGQPVMTREEDDGISVALDPQSSKSILAIYLALCSRSIIVSLDFLVVFLQPMACKGIASVFKSPCGVGKVMFLSGGNSKRGDNERDDEQGFWWENGCFV